MMRTITGSITWHSGKDRILFEEVYTEIDFRRAWNRIEKEAREGGYVVQEGHLFTHASKPGGENSGLEFAAVPDTGDGTINQSEMANLSVLPWRKNGKLYLHGCNTGRTGERRNWTPAEAFANTQKVDTTGTLGFSYFSTSRRKYEKISGTSTTVYLLPFRRGKNGIFGDGTVIPPKTFQPKA
ncbi:MULTISPECIES: hypothetical protein [Cupriavidus]